jgi:hypothetical protein
MSVPSVGSTDVQVDPMQAKSTEVTEPNSLSRSSPTGVRSQRPLDSSYALSGTIPKVTLSQAHNMEPQGSETPANEGVSAEITGNLRLPICPVRFWNMSALRTPMPEAAIDENGDTARLEQKIRFPHDALGVPAPPMNSSLSQ